MSTQISTAPLRAGLLAPAAVASDEAGDKVIHINSGLRYCDTQKVELAPRQGQWGGIRWRRPSACGSWRSTHGSALRARMNTAQRTTAPPPWRSSARSTWRAIGLPRSSARDLGGYLAQLEIGRGELEAGIIDALMAIRLTKDPKDRFYSEIDLADGLQKLAESCDYRPLVDAKSSEDRDDVYGACRRAVAAARAVYEQAGSTAASLGWTHLVDEAGGFESRLEIRGKLIDMRASADKMSFGNVFHPRSGRDVLVNRNFEAGASTLIDTPALASLIESVVAEAEVKTGRKDARNEYLLGLSKDIRRAPPEAAGQYYAEAAGMLAAERALFSFQIWTALASEDRVALSISLVEKAGTERPSVSRRIARSPMISPRFSITVPRRRGSKKPVRA